MGTSGMLLAAMRNKHGGQPNQQLDVRKRYPASNSSFRCFLPRVLPIPHRLGGGTETAIHEARASSPLFEFFVVLLLKNLPKSNMSAQLNRVFLSIMRFVQMVLLLPVCLHCLLSDCTCAIGFEVNSAISYLRSNSICLLQFVNSAAYCMRFSPSFSSHSNVISVPVSSSSSTYPRSIALGPVQVAKAVSSCDPHLISNSRELSLRPSLAPDPGPYQNWLMECTANSAFRIASVV